jgi:cysteine desulfurase
MRTIYFDYNATTPLDPAVRLAMLPYLDDTFGNPSSVHHVGRKARAMLDDARDRLAKMWKSRPSEIVFTSGGTESNNLAIFGTARQLKGKGRHLITSQIEHHAVLHSFQYLAKKEGFEVTFLPVSADGLVDPSLVAKNLRPDTTLVSVMAVNNEIGTIQRVAEIGKICQEHGVLFHTDAVQSFGKLPFSSIHDFKADLVSVCAHKFYGPKGVGALFIRSPHHPDPILFGGAHENERRAGTENLFSVVGLVEAFERFALKTVFQSPAIRDLTDRLGTAAQAVPGVKLLGSQTQRVDNTVAFSVEGADSIALMAGFDLEGVCASSGSACSAGSLEPSHVVLALGVPEAAANSLVRFSLGKESTGEEVETVCDLLPHVINRLRKG